jgi:SAM-dependent methyltransferase
MELVIEKNHVYDTYQLISNEFDKSRHHIWPCVRDFLDKAHLGQSLLEIGCGNGKNLLYRQADLNGIGIDLVPNFVRICTEKGLRAIEGSAIDLPFSDGVFDNCISVAVFHHLASEERRIKALREMYRVLKIGGRGMIVCWAYEQAEGDINHSALGVPEGNTWQLCNPDRKRSIVNKELHRGDQYIGWRGRAGGERYYYCYDREGFEKYTSNISVLESRIWWQKGNWVFEFTK